MDLLAKHFSAVLTCFSRSERLKPWDPVTGYGLLEWHLFGWLAGLPWNDPVVVSSELGISVEQDNCWTDLRHLTGRLPLVFVTAPNWTAWVCLKSQRFSSDSFPVALLVSRSLLSKRNEYFLIPSQSMPGFSRTFSKSSSSSTAIARLFSSGRFLFFPEQVLWGVIM